MKDSENTQPAAASATPACSAIAGSLICYADENGDESGNALLPRAAACITLLCEQLDEAKRLLGQLCDATTRRGAAGADCEADLVFAVWEAHRDAMEFLEPNGKDQS